VTGGGVVGVAAASAPVLPASGTDSARPSAGVEPLPNPARPGSSAAWRARELRSTRATITPSAANASAGPRRAANPRPRFWRQPLCPRRDWLPMGTQREPASA